MLGAVVGRDKVIARVTASFDFSRVERTEETYDPDRTALRSRRSTREETVGNPPPGGAPGVQANLTNDAASAATASPRSERRDDNQSFEVSKVVSRTVAPVGVLTRLSVAVLIDGTYAEGEGGARVFTPRPAEEVERLKGLVQNAIGFNAERGDAIEIASVPFQAEPVPEGEGFLGAVGRWLPAVATRVGAVGFVVAMLLWVVRPVVLGVAGRRASGPARIDAELDAAMGALTHQNLSIAQEHPERAARLVREWLLESAGGAGTART
jgi:flagellar M-ring protein FliF